MGVSPISGAIPGASTNASVGAQAAHVSAPSEVNNVQQTAHSQPTAKVQQVAKTQQDVVTLSPAAHALQLFQDGASLDIIAAVLDTTVAAVATYLNLPTPTSMTSGPATPTSTGSSIKI